MLKKILTKDYFFLFLLVLISIIVYSSGLKNPQFFWDDERFVFANPTVLDAPYWYSFWIKNSEFYKTWPVSYLFFWILVKIHIADSIVLLKNLNIWLHAFNAFLVYRILKKKLLPLPFFCSLFFLVHPLGIETVGWIFQLTGILALAFFLSSILFLLDFVSLNKKISIIFSLLFFQLSLWSKGVAIPHLLIILLILIFNKRSVWLIIPFLIMGVNSGLSNRFGTDHFLRESKSSNIQIISKDNILQKYNEATSFKSNEKPMSKDSSRLEFFDYIHNKKKIKDEIKFNSFDNFTIANWHYFKMLFVPYDQHFIYQSDPQLILSVVVILILVATTMIIIYFKLNFELLLLPGWYICSVVLYLGFTYISFFYWSPVSDRYTYFLIVLVPFIFSAILIKWKNKIIVFMLSIYLAFYLIQNIAYGRKFNNYIESYSEILTYRPHPQIYSNLIEQYILKLDLKNAEDTLKKATSQFPDDPNLADDIIRVKILRENLKN